MQTHWKDNIKMRGDSEKSIILPSPFRLRLTCKAARIISIPRYKAQDKIQVGFRTSIINNTYR